MPNGAQYSSHEMSSYMYFHFTSGTVQDLIFSSYVDPTFFSFNIEVESGKISLKKVNNIGNAISGCQFELYSDSNCSNKVNSGTTSSDGTILFEKLKPGTYYIKETASKQSLYGRMAKNRVLLAKRWQKSEKIDVA